MLADGLHRKSVASTLSEIRGLLPLVREGLLDEVRHFNPTLLDLDCMLKPCQCLYGIPVCQSALPELFELRQSIAILLMIDNEQHLQLLQDFNQRNDCQHSWSVFIKVDVGSHRAGLLAGSVALTDLVQRAEASPAVSIHGFYCHAGHAYACRNPDDLAAVLQAEVHGLLTASELITSGKPLVLSVGATPTAHVVRSLLKIEIPDNVSLELHAGILILLPQSLQSI